MTLIAKRSSLTWKEFLKLVGPRDSEQAKRWAPVVRRLSYLRKAMETNCPQLFRSAVAVVKSPHGRPEIRWLLFITYSQSFEETLDALAERVLGPLSLEDEEAWIPPSYSIRTEEEWGLASTHQDETWQEVTRFGITFYGEHLFNGVSQ